MRRFSYVVENKEGKILKGILEADSREKLIEYFQKESCIIFSLDETKKTKIHSRGKIKSDDLVIFSRQFTTLIESGISIMESLETLKEQVEKPYFKEVIGVIIKDVREGAALSSALAKHPRVFPEIYISMVEAAEVTGGLAEILDRLALYLEKSSALRKKILSSLYYPVIIILMALSITAFLILKVVPTFKNIYDMLGGTLPFPTRILIMISELLSRYIIPVGIVSAAFFFFFVKYIRTPKGQKQYHTFLLKLPIIGDLIQKISIARFARTFATLIKSGVTIVKCLDIVAKTSGNKVIDDAVMKAKKFIQEGQPISVPLKDSGVFPVMVIKMIAVGEKSGRLEALLGKIAQFYEEQTDAMVAGLTSIIEPLIILFLGIGVGGIVVALFLPIVQITQYLGVS